MLKIFETSFYIHSPYSASTGGSKSIILVTSCQVQHFLVTINNALQIHLKIPDAAIESGLLFAFPKDGTPRPRYLGHTSEREMAECLKRAVPSANYRPSGEVEDKCEPTEQSLEAFKEKIELLVESKKKKTTVSKEKKKAERFARQRAWNRQIKRVQRYLGLRESHHGHKMVGNTTVKTSEDPGLGEYAFLLYLVFTSSKPIPLRVYSFESPGRKSLIRLGNPLKAPSAFKT